jgi:hypothetical protein
MEATARTFRYLDPKRSRQKAAAKGARKKRLAANLIALLGALLLRAAAAMTRTSCASGWRPARDHQARHAAAEPKQFHPQDYTGDGNMEPFNPQKLTQALRRESSETVANALIAPRWPAQGAAGSLSAGPMKMVGSLNKTGVPTALVRVDKLLYQVAWAITWARTTERSSDLGNEYPARNRPGRHGRLDERSNTGPAGGK